MKVYVNSNPKQVPVNIHSSIESAKGFWKRSAARHDDVVRFEYDPSYRRWAVVLLQNSSTFPTIGYIHKFVVLSDD